MESQQPTAYQNGPPLFPAAQMASQKLAMDLDCEDERRNRAASVLSGMSQEDMEAAETLNSLQAREITELHFRKISTDYPRFSFSLTTTSSDTDPISNHILAKRPAGASVLPPHLTVPSNSINDQSIVVRVPRDAIPHTRSLHR